MADDLAKMRASMHQRMRELSAIVRADIREFFEKDGTPKRLQDVPENLRIAIMDCKVDPITGRIRELTLKDRVDAAEELLRFMGEGHKPEVIALLKAAREAQCRNAAIMEAMEAMKADTYPDRDRVPN